MEKEIQPDFRLVAIDETRNWNMNVVNAVDALYGIYLVDKNAITYCCSQEPCYWCFFIRTEYTGGPQDELALDDLNMRIMDGDAYTDDMYFSKDFIDKLPCTENILNEYNIDIEDYDPSDTEGLQSLINDIREEYHKNPISVKELYEQKEREDKEQEDKQDVSP